MKKETQLLIEIEQYRSLLNKTAKNTSIISEEMLKYSQKLDQLLNEYENLLTKITIKQ
ncbi:aspartyl-phosphate phosphatase Spo0E family protein [Halalkalibacter kiskunsagensis]|uniref:Aspartyl-phosphate phosphatase Spo0E family protein n=1 Tax=Halalkalibacter kiskunsagensis TaxID=1548599 RepID=A0ABV6K9R8_9BACI